MYMYTRNPSATYSVHVHVKGSHHTCTSIDLPIANGSVSPIYITTGVALWWTIMTLAHFTYYAYAFVNGFQVGPSFAYLTLDMSATTHF